MEITIVDITGKETGKKVKLSEKIFSIEPNDHAIYLDVKQFLANRRQGTHKSKERAEIARTTKKLKRQKGTGGARAGSMKSPLFVGGGRAFGPRPRDYSFKLNKKLKHLACLSALTYKAKDKSITVVENFNMADPKTKGYTDIMKNLKLSDKKVLMVLPQHDSNIFLSSRNVQRNKVTTAAELNTYDVLNAQTIVFVEGSVPVLENRFLAQ
ncbi:MAG: 50S ribosomal protein L4 [Bacteroidetes bacterium]|nr:MAG: 50S ribosomal protein L4 [Bacteroidota bacterium]